MRVKLINNKIDISFSYDYQLVSWIKNLENRVYNVNSHSWSIPETTSLETLKKLRDKGFLIDQEVIDHVRAIHQQAQEAEAIAILPDTTFNTPLPLYNFQRVGAAFLCKIGSGILGDSPGLGKTLQGLAVAEKIQAQKVLIFTPSAVKWQFANEIERFLPGNKIVIVDGSADKRRELWKTEARFYIANYELLLRDLPHIDREWDLILADEATKISNPFAKQSKAIKKLRAKRRIAMTGTPISNRANDLYNIADFTNPGCMGNYFNFISRYCIKNQWGGIWGYQNLDELKSKLHRYMIRRTREEVLPELPEKTEIDVPFELSDEERTLYNRLKKELLFEISKEDISKLEHPMTISYTLTKLLRLQQMVNSMELLGENKKSTKVEVLKEVIAEQEAEDKFVVYTKFSQFADILERELSEYKPLKITGEVKDRQKLIDLFNNTGDNKIMIITDAASYGINLQFRCANIIFMDQPFSLAKLEQVIGRIYRIGQKKAVRVYSLLGIKTVDYHLKKILISKKSLSDSILTMNDIQTMLL